jgi:hypothetical protein
VKGSKAMKITFAILEGGDFLSNEEGHRKKDTDELFGNFQASLLALISTLTLASTTPILSYLNFASFFSSCF